MTRALLGLVLAAAPLSAQGPAGQLPSAHRRHPPAGVRYGAGECGHADRTGLPDLCPLHSRPSELPGPRCRHSRHGAHRPVHPPRRAEAGGTRDGPGGPSPADADLPAGVLRQVGGSAPAPRGEHATISHGGARACAVHGQVRICGGNRAAEVRSVSPRRCPWCSRSRMPTASRSLRFGSPSRPTTPSCVLRLRPPTPPGTSASTWSLVIRPEKV